MSRWSFEVFKLHGGPYLYMTFHDKIIGSKPEREEILHKDTYLPELHLVDLRTIRIDNNSLCRHIIRSNVFFPSKTIKKRVLFSGIALAYVFYL